MAKWKQPATGSPKNKRVRHAPPSPANSAAGSARSTSPHETETTEEVQEAEDPKDDIGLWETWDVHPFRLTFRLERLSKEWKSPVYAFYQLIPEHTQVKGCPCHEFKCAARGCKYKSQCYLDTKDKASTGNLIKHAKSCWGNEAWNTANECKNAMDARATVTNPIKRSGSITSIFKWMGKGKVTYTHRMHMKSETKWAGHWVPLMMYLWYLCFRAEIVRWVAESIRPFSIVEDCSFKLLMKTGRPEYYLLPTFHVHSFSWCEAGVRMNMGVDQQDVAGKN